MADQVSSLIVRLIDQVTGPAKSVANALRGIGTAVKANGGVTGMDRIDAAIARNTARTTMYRAQMLDAIATLYTLKKALTAPIEAAQGYEKALTELGNKSGMSSEQLRVFGQRAMEIGRTTNQYTSDILKGADILIGFGMDAETAAKSLETIGRASTATGASVDDMSKLAYASISNLKVPVQELTLAFDALDKAGKLGGFELRDMAQYFPELGAAASTFGQTGVKAVVDLGAALQIVRRSTGDASQAANALANLYQKMRAPMTVAKFKDFGVDIREEITKGIAAGKSPIEVMVEQTRAAMKKGAILEDLFSDKQVLEAMRPLLQFYDDYLKLREEAANSAGTVLADFEAKMKTNAERTQSFRIALDNLAISIGNALLPSLTKIMTLVTPVVDRFAKWAEAHPKLTAAIVGSVAGFLALGAALTIIKYASAVSFGGVLNLAKYVGMLGEAIAGPGLSSGALLGFGLGVAAVAAAVGAWAYVNWDEITAGWDAFWNRLSLSSADSAKLDDLSSRLKGLSGIDLSGILKMKEGSGAAAGTWLGDLTNDFVHEGLQRLATDMRDLEALKPALEAIWNPDITGLGDKISSAMRGAMDRVRVAIDEGLASALASITSWGSQAVAAIQSIAGQMYSAGVALVQSLWDGMKAQFDALIGWVKGKAAEIANSVSLGYGGARTGGAPSTAGSSGPADYSPVEDLTKKARGGPVSRGSSYIVGERRPEIFTPSQNGYISQLGKGQGGGGMIAPTFNLTFNGSVDQSTVDKIRSVLRDEVRQAFRGVYADAGLRFA